MNISWHWHLTLKHDQATALHCKIHVDVFTKWATVLTGLVSTVPLHRCSSCTVGETLCPLSTPLDVIVECISGITGISVHSQLPAWEATLLWNPFSLPSDKLFILPPVYSACLAAFQGLESARSEGISPQATHWRLGKSAPTSAGEVGCRQNCTCMFLRILLFMLKIKKRRVASLIVGVKSTRKRNFNMSAIKHVVSD